MELTVLEQLAGFGEEGMQERGGSQGGPGQEGGAAAAGSSGVEEAVAAVGAAVGQADWCGFLAAWVQTLSLLRMVQRVRGVWGEECGVG